MPNRKSIASPDPLAEEPEEEVTFGPEDAEEPEEEDEVDVDEVLQRAQHIAQEIATVVKSDKRAAKRKLKELETLLASITLAQVPELADSPVIQSFVQMFAPKNLQPGQVLNRGTLAEVSFEWTLREMVDRFPMKTFTAMESLPLTWNGVRYDVVAGNEYTLPEPFWALYHEHVMAGRSGEARIRAMLDANAPLPANPNYWDEASARVRATTQLGHGRRSFGPIRDDDLTPDAGSTDG